MGVIGLAGGGEVGKALAAGHPVVVLMEAELLALGARTARVGRGDHQLRVEQLNVEPHEAEDLGEGGVKIHKLEERGVAAHEAMQVEPAAPLAPTLVVDVVLVREDLGHRGPRPAEQLRRHCVWDPQKAIASPALALLRRQGVLGPPLLGGRLRRRHAGLSLHLAPLRQDPPLTPDTTWAGAPASAPALRAASAQTLFLSCSLVFLGVLTLGLQRLE